MSTKKKWLELGVITKNEVKDKNGQVVKNKDGTSTTRLGIKLNDEVVTVLRKAGYDITQYGVLTTPIDEVERLISNGAITEDKAEDRRTKAKEVNSWLRYKIQLPPPKET